MEENGVIHLTLLQMGAAYLFVVILLLIVRIKKMNKEKEILLSTIRMTIQLVLVGYILIFLFENRHPLFTLGVIAIMEAFAIYNIFKRSKKYVSVKLKRIVALSMTIGTLSSLFYFILVIVQITPWYDPRYFIPIAGMLIGNSMTGISLGVNRMIDGMEEQRNLIESALMMGATPKMASRTVIEQSFDSAILPTINSMLGMGIVFLPGMMTGQILSGTSPLTAIEYQIAIMLGILGSVSITVILFIQLGYKTFYNKNAQLVIDKDSY